MKPSPDRFSLIAYNNAIGSRSGGRVPVRIEGRASPFTYSPFSGKNHSKWVHFTERLLVPKLIKIGSPISRLKFTGSNPPESTHSPPYDESQNLQPNRSIRVISLE